MKRVFLLVLLFILIILTIIIGNNIHVRTRNNRFDYLETYKKEKNKKKIIHIDVENKTLYLIDNTNKEIIKKYTVATGKSNSRTPLGNFTIIEKGKWGEGFGSRWLGLDVPWGIYGIHGTNKPGSIGLNVSAGCVRMRNTDVEEVFDQVEVGTRVVITNGLYGPFGYGYREIRPGDRGSDVLEIQKRLYKLGYYSGEFDGIYGEGMKKEFIDFLKDNNIELTDRVTPEILELLNIVLME